MPWFERSFHFDFPVGLFPIIFSRLEGSIFRLSVITQSATEEKLTYNVTGWSVKEHVGHLSDLEELWWNRLNDFQQKKAILTAADLTNSKTKKGGHNDKALELLLSQFALERQKILETI